MTPKRSLKEVADAERRRHAPTLKQDPGTGAPAELDLELVRRRMAKALNMPLDSTWLQIADRVAGIERKPIGMRISELEHEVEEVKFSSSAVARFQARVAEKVKADPKLEVADAQRQVSAEEPELYAEMRRDRIAAQTNEGGTLR